MSTGVSGVCIGQIPGMGNGGDPGTSDNDDNVEEGGSHSTPLTMATRELVARLCYTGILYTSEAFLLDMEDVNRRRQGQAIDHPMIMKKEVILAK